MKTLARIAKMSENKEHYANEESTVGREKPGSRWERKTMVNARGCNRKNVSFLPWNSKKGLKSEHKNETKLR